MSRDLHGPGIYHVYAFGTGMGDPFRAINQVKAHVSPNFVHNLHVPSTFSTHT
jgi:hypothetical protein